MVTLKMDALSCNLPLRFTTCHKMENGLQMKLFTPQINSSKKVEEANSNACKKMKSTKAIPHKSLQIDSKLSQNKPSVVTPIKTHANPYQTAKTLQHLSTEELQKKEIWFKLRNCKTEERFEWCKKETWTRWKVKQTFDKKILRTFDAKNEKPDMSTRYLAKHVSRIDERVICQEKPNAGKHNEQEKKQS